MPPPPMLPPPEATETGRSRERALLRSEKIPKSTSTRGGSTWAGDAAVAHARPLQQGVAERPESRSAASQARDTHGCLEVRVAQRPDRSPASATPPGR